MRTGAVLLLQALELEDVEMDINEVLPSREWPPTPWCARRAADHLHCGASPPAWPPASGQATGRPRHADRHGRGAPVAKDYAAKAQLRHDPGRGTAGTSAPSGTPGEMTAAPERRSDDLTTSGTQLPRTMQPLPATNPPRQTQPTPTPPPPRRRSLTRQGNGPQRTSRIRRGIRPRRTGIWRTPGRRPGRPPSTVPPRSLPHLCRCGSAVGRTLAADITARQDMPHYASSAMDGWAVNGSGPWILAEPGQRLAPHQASPIVTGGLIPPGAKAVLRSESGVIATDEDGLPVLTAGRYRPARRPRNGQHIRKAGEEAAAGDVLVKARHGPESRPSGPRRPGRIRRPCRSSASRGEAAADRLRGGGPRDCPAPGQVRDTFGPQLAAVVEMLGGICAVAGERSATATGRVAGQGLEDCTASLTARKPAGRRRHHHRRHGPLRNRPPQACRG